MGLFGRWFGRKAMAEANAPFLIAPATRAGVAVTTETAMGVTAFLCGARVIAEGVAQLPLKVMRERHDGERTYRQPARDHWAYDLLHRQPNGWMTSYELRETLTLHAVATGNGVAIKNIVDGRIRELLPVRPDQLEIEQTADWNVVYTVRDRQGIVGRFASDRVLHVRGPSWNSYLGLDIVRLARESLGLTMASERSQALLHKTGGRPSGVLSSEQNLSNETVARLKGEWNERYGPGGDGGIAVLDGGWKFAPLTMSGVDAQHVETRRFQIEEVGRLLRVNPMMMMQADKTATYASAEQFFIAHVIHTLGPWIERWEQALDRDILGHAPDVYSHFVVQGLMRGAAKDRAEYYAKALGSGGGQAWMTANDVRGEEDMNPHADGDALNAPAGSIQGQIQEQVTP